MKEKILLTPILIFAITMMGCYTQIFPPSSQEDEFIGRENSYDYEFYSYDFSNYQFAPEFYYGLNLRYGFSPLFSPYSNFYNPFMPYFPYYPYYPYYSLGLNRFYLDFLYSGYPPYLASSYLSPWYYDPYYSSYYGYNSLYFYPYSYYYNPYYYFISGSNRKKYVHGRGSGRTFTRKRKTYYSSSPSSSSAEAISPPVSTTSGTYLPLSPVTTETKINIRKGPNSKEVKTIHRSVPTPTTSPDAVPMPKVPKVRTRIYSLPPTKTSCPTSERIRRSTGQTGRKKATINRRRK